MTRSVERWILFETAAPFTIHHGTQRVEAIDSEGNEESKLGSS
jgi:hypothetical protein